MHSKCSANNSKINSKISNKSHNYLFSTLIVILLTAIIYYILNYIYNSRKIDRFNDTIDDNRWASYTRYSIKNDNTIEAEDISFDDKIQKNLDTDKYLALDNVSDSTKPEITSGNVPKLNLKGLEDKIYDQNNKIMLINDIITNIKDTNKIMYNTQFNESNKLIDILSNKLHNNLYNKLNEQNNMAYKLLLQDNYNSINYN